MGNPQAKFIVTQQDLRQTPRPRKGHSSLTNMKSLALFRKVRDPVLVKAPELILFVYIYFFDAVFESHDVVVRISFVFGRCSFESRLAAPRSGVVAV